MLDSKLQTLITIQETGSFSKAAEKLCLTQPAVSHQIRLLEQELGAPLFERSRKGLRMTSEGEIALRYARRLNALYEDMNAEILHVDHSIKRLRVGITHTTESNSIAAALAKYSSRAHSPQVTLLTDSSQNLYKMLDSFAIDLAIVDEKPPKSFDSRLLITDSLVLIMPVSHPLGKKEIVSLSDLKKEKLILRLPSSETRQLLDKQLGALGKTLDEFNVFMEMDNIATIKDCVRQNLGLSILPQSACVNEIKKKKLLQRPIKNLSLIRETSLVYLPEFPEPKIIGDIVAACQKAKGNQ